MDGQKLLPPRISHIEQGFANDCTIACVAMITGLPVSAVFANVRLDSGWVPSAEYKRGSGLSPVEVLHACGFDVGMRRRSTSSLTLDKPSITTVESLKHPPGRHAVVIAHGVVYDPAVGPRASLRHVRDTWAYQYFVR